MRFHFRSTEHSTFPRPHLNHKEVLCGGDVYCTAEIDMVTLKALVISTVNHVHRLIIAFFFFIISFSHSTLLANRLESSERHFHDKRRARTWIHRGFHRHDLGPTSFLRNHDVLWFNYVRNFKKDGIERRL